MLPVSIIEEPIDERMVSTVCHNKARSSHDMDLMSNIIKEPREFGHLDTWIVKHPGADRDGVLRLKQITGFIALLRDIGFGETQRPVGE